jgi:hypothetical protein
VPSSITHGAADFLDELATKLSTTFSVVVSSQSAALILLLSLRFLSPASRTAIDNDQKVQWFKVQSFNAACLCLCCGGAESNLVTTAFSSEFLAGFLAEAKMPV